MTEPTCATCRYVSISKQQKVETVLGMRVPIKDEFDVTHTCWAFADSSSSPGSEANAPAMCIHAGNVVPSTFTCSTWAGKAPKSDRLAELDRRIAERDARFGTGTSAATENDSDRRTR